MKLNARQVETAKPGEKDYKLPDGNGLILLVKTSGAKYWRYRYKACWFCHVSAASFNAWHRPVI